MNEALGKDGEQIVINYLSGIGGDVVQSENKYDRVKDFIYDGKKCELKTQVPWIFEESFTVRPNQINKLCNADEVYFLAIANNKFQRWWDGWLFKHVNEKNNIIKFKNFKMTKDGDRFMALIDINSLERVVQFDEGLINQLKRNSISYWN